MVSIYKGKQECSSYRVINLFSTVTKLYTMILIGRVMKSTNNKIWNVQAIFMNGTDVWVYG